MQQSKIGYNYKYIVLAINNGYKFNEDSKNRIYNSDMALYFLNQLYVNEKYPKQMIDNNVKTDYGRLNKMSLSFKNDDELFEIITNEEVEVTLAERFNLEYMFNNKENFKSLLYYMGMLTIKEAAGSKLKLKIPNYVIKTVYWEYLINKISETFNIDYDDLDKGTKSMRNLGKIESFVEYISKVLEALSNRDLQRFDEKYIKVVIMAFMVVDNMYIIHSEFENRNGYADLLLTANKQYAHYIDYEWLIELKYIKESDRNKLHEVKEQGLSQLMEYSDSKEIKERVTGKILKKVLVVVIGKKDMYVEYLE